MVLANYIAEAGVEEPMWIYLSSLRRAYCEQRYIKHLVDIREIAGLTLTSPSQLRSHAAQTMVQRGILSIRSGAKPLLEIEF